MALERRKLVGFTPTVLCLIIIGILMVFVYDKKTGALSQRWKSKQEIVTPIPPVIVTPTVHKSYDADISRLENSLKNIKTEIGKLQENVKFNSQRITLTGMILNENFIIFRNNYDKNHVIFFNRDWTLDQMPHYLQLSDEDKQYLQKYTKPQ